MSLFNQITTFYCLCLLRLSCQALMQSQKQNYVIGGWGGMPAAVLQQKMSPLMQTYLNQEVGNLYSPPISFTFVPFFYNASNSPAAMIAAGELDFAYHNGGGVTCLQAEYGYATIATQVTETMGQESSCYGSVIFSAKSNAAIKSMTDFKKKKLGVGYPWGPGTYLLGSKLLDANGLNIFTKFNQVTFYLSDYNRMLEDLLAGIIDVGMMQSEWIESNLPDQIPLLRYHNLVNTSYAGQPYPFRTSTDVVPSYGLVAAQNVPAQLSQQIAAALRKLKSSHPAAIASGISTFTLPASYEATRSMVERLGMMIDTPDGKQCLDIFTGLDHFVTCPSGYALKDRATVINSCAAAGLPCPAGMACYCRPCVSLGKNSFPWEQVLGLCCGLCFVGVCFRLWFSAMGDDERHDIGGDFESFKRLLVSKGSKV